MESDTQDRRIDPGSKDGQDGLGAGDIFLFPSLFFCVSVRTHRVTDTPRTRLVAVSEN